MSRRAITAKPDTEQPKVKLTKETLGEALEIFKYIKPYRVQFFIGLILLSISSVIFMFVLYLAGQMIDIAQGISDLPYTLNQIGLILMGIFILQGIISFFRVYLFAYTAENGIAAIRKALYAKMITLPIIFYEQNRLGELISRITADIEMMYSAFSLALAEFVRQVIILIVGILFLAVTMPKLSLIMLATFPFIVILALLFGRYIRKLSKERQEVLAETNTIMNETVTSIRSVKSFTSEEYESKRYGSTITRVVTIAMKYAKARGMFAAFMVSILSGALFFVIWQGAMMVKSESISAGDLVSFVAYTASIGAAIAGLGNFYSQLLGAIGATERVREILKEEGELDNVDETAVVNLKGDIVFNGVQFSYPTRTDIEVLKSLNLTVKSGQKVALVGASGSGKSTIVQLLLRFYGIQGGQITVDGQDITDYDIKAYRQNFGMVPQEVLLFGGTIRENILYGRPDATEAELITATKQSNSWEFISGFPEGLDTIVGERGIKLSGGQRQRIAIARAILKDPAILLLDEATSSLDAESEHVVQDALDKLMQNRTSIIIAHRLSTVKDVDKIFVIDDGQVIEQGTHAELSQREEGVYTHLVHLSSLS